MIGISLKLIRFPLFSRLFSMSQFLTASQVPNEVYKLLAPSDEALKTLRTIDFSSFDDHSQKSISVYDIKTDSEDPFDPDDLVGIVDNKGIEIKAEELKIEREIELDIEKERKIQSEHIVKKDPLLEVSCLSQNLPIRKESSIKVTSTPLRQVKVESTSPSRTSKAHVTVSQQYEYIPLFLSPFSSPEAKRLRIASSPEVVRAFHTSATLGRDTSGPKFEVKKLQNATIQLATQRQFGPAFEKIDPEAPEEKVVRPIILSAEQERVLQLALQGKSIFFTGSAGTGKSVLLRAIIKRLKNIHNPGEVAVTASTGLAACNIGGITVHSFAGIGLGKGAPEDLLKFVRRNRRAVDRWMYTSVLIIDEISMIEGGLFDKLDWLARRIRKNHNEPFGGIQIIICGDFYQLPPISKLKINVDGSESRDDTLFAFESLTWKKVLDAKIVLKEVFRQKGDQEFVDMLNEMRRGIVTDRTERELMKLSRPLECPEGIVPTELYATRFEVDNANNIKLSNLPGKSKVYESRDGGSLPPAPRAQMLNNFLAPQKLFLKEKAQVMCIKNFDSTLVNGSLGQVIAFVDRDTYMCEQVMEEMPDISLEGLKKELIKRKIKRELPADAPEPDDKTIEEISQAAASQVPLLDSVFNFLYQDSTDENIVLDQSSSLEDVAKINTRRKVEFLKSLQESAKGEKYPLVRFLNPDGITTRDVLVEPEIWEIKDDKTEEVLVSRVQLPLMLAWALSIHKSQGQTLHRVKINLGRIFENGQAYVALSRAVSRNGLQVLNFRKDKVRAHHGVIDFYESLTSVYDTKEEDN